MKIYYAENSIRLSGKAKDIRKKLKEWSKLSISVKAFLMDKGH